METANNGKERRRLKLIALNKSRATHGRANSKAKGYADRTYGIWQAFRDRCNNPNRKDYKYYGGKGVTYDPRWDSFECFVTDMCECPEGLTLDRIDSTKGYSKDNCQWATRHQQAYNSSRIKWIELDGVIKSASDWIREAGIARTTFYKRIKKGYTEQEALFGKVK